MTTKLVTGYWMGIANRPYVGAAYARQERYLGSLISTCKSFNVPIVCYTQQSNLVEVETVKRDYNLYNLEIKLKELDEAKYVNQFKHICSVKTVEEIAHLNGRPPEVMWGKIDVLMDECTSDTEHLYWIDIGLQSNQIMPYKYCPEFPDTIKAHSELPMEVFNTRFKQFNFSRLLNQKILDALQQRITGKLLLIPSTTPQCTYYELEDYKIDTSYPNHAHYPIGGFFGGDKSAVIEYCNKFYEGAELFFRNNVIDHEQSVMKYAMDMMPKEKMILDYWFAAHIIPEYFHYNKWTPESNVEKPLYVAFEDILNGL